MFDENTKTSSEGEEDEVAVGSDDPSVVSAVPNRVLAPTLFIYFALQVIHSQCISSNRKGAIRNIQVLFD